MEVVVLGQNLDNERLINAISPGGIGYIQNIFGRNYFDLDGEMIPSIFNIWWQVSFQKEPPFDVMMVTCPLSVIHSVIFRPNLGFGYGRYISVLAWCRAIEVMRAHFGRWTIVFP